MTQKAILKYWSWYFFYFEKFCNSFQDSGLTGMGLKLFRNNITMF